MKRNNPFWEVNHFLWHKFWFYRNIFPYAYKFGRGFLFRKLQYDKKITK